MKLQLSRSRSQVRSCTHIRLAKSKTTLRARRECGDQRNHSGQQKRRRVKIMPSMSVQGVAASVVAVLAGETCYEAYFRSVITLNFLSRYHLLHTLIFIHVYYHKPSPIRRKTYSHNRSQIEPTLRKIISHRQHCTLTEEYSILVIPILISAM